MDGYVPITAVKNAMTGSRIRLDRQRGPGIRREAQDAVANFVVSSGADLTGIVGGVVRAGIDVEIVENALGAILAYRDEKGGQIRTAVAPCAGVAQ